jgi:hypothetical protein
MFDLVGNRFRRCCALGAACLGVILSVVGASAQGVTVQAAILCPIRELGAEYVRLIVTDRLEGNGHICVATRLSPARLSGQMGIC